jgi:hypothetical protein
MSWARWCAGIALAVALGLLAGAPVARAAITGTAPLRHSAVIRHPAAAANHAAAAAHHHARHRHQHVVPAATLSAKRMPTHASAPFSPRPRSHRRENHRATLPSFARLVRQPIGSKVGPKHSGLPSANGAPLALPFRALEPRQNEVPDALEHPVTGGRGPPRAGPPTAPRGPTAHPRAAIQYAPPGASAALNPAHPTPHSNRRHPPASLRTVLFAPHADPRHASAAFRPATTAPGVPTSPVFPRPPARRLLAVRPEGATACFYPPSNGGFPCPAPPAFSRSGWRFS